MSSKEAKMEVKVFIWICGFMSLAMAQDQLFMQSRQNFGLDLFHKSREQVNLLISPISMDYALNVLFLGSAKKTFTDMKKGLEYPKNYSLGFIESNLQKWTGAVGQMQGVEMATKLYVNKTVKTMTNYTKLVRKKLNATTESIAFIKSLESSRKINAWIANATHNLITYMIPPQALTSKTKLLIINCLYFKASWQVPFKKSSTFKGTFNAFDGTTKLVDFMTRTGFFDYNPKVDELNGAAAVSLPYKDSNASMLFILPPSDTDFDTWVGGISNVDWNAVDNSLNTTHVNVTIPKFNVTYFRFMTQVIGNMSMANIFSNASNFDKIFTAPYRKKTNICDIIQKTVICVDEAGTLAAAVTVMMMGAGRPTETPEFVADRPFMYVIRSGPTILFIGQYIGKDQDPFVF